MKDLVDKIIFLLGTSLTTVDSSYHPEIMEHLRNAGVQGLERFEYELAYKFDEIKDRDITRMKRVESTCGNCHKGLPVLNFLTDDDPFFNIAILIKYSSLGEIEEIQFCSQPVLIDDLLHE